MATGKTIWLTKAEFALLTEGKEMFRQVTGVKLSWGTYLCALSLGAVAARSIAGILMRCPNCGHDVELVMRKMTATLARQDRLRGSSALRSRTPEGVLVRQDPPAP